jgi:hypothetical protein
MQATMTPMKTTLKVGRKILLNRLPIAIDLA